MSLTYDFDIRPGDACQMRFDQQCVWKIYDDDKRLYGMGASLMPTDVILIICVIDGDVAYVSAGGHLGYIATFRLKRAF